MKDALHLLLGQERRSLGDARLMDIDKRLLHDHNQAQRRHADDHDHHDYFNKGEAFIFHRLLHLPGIGLNCNRAAAV